MGCLWCVVLNTGKIPTESLHFISKRSGWRLYVWFYFSGCKDCGSFVTVNQEGNYVIVHTSSTTLCHILFLPYKLSLQEITSSCCKSCLYTTTINSLSIHDPTLSWNCVPFLFRVVDGWTTHPLFPVPFLQVQKEDFFSSHLYFCILLIKRTNFFFWISGKERFFLFLK